MTVNGSFGSDNNKTGADVRCYLSDSNAYYAEVNHLYSLSLYKNIVSDNIIAKNSLTNFL